MGKVKNIVLEYLEKHDADVVPEGLTIQDLINDLEGDN